MHHLHYCIADLGGIRIAMLWVGLMEAPHAIKSYGMYTYESSSLNVDSCHKSSGTNQWRWICEWAMNWLRMQVSCGNQSLGPGGPYSSGARASQTLLLPFNTYSRSMLFSLHFLWDLSCVKGDRSNGCNASAAQTADLKRARSSLIPGKSPWSMSSSITELLMMADGVPSQVILLSKELLPAYKQQSILLQGLQ